MPDDAALAALHVLPGRLHAKVLVVPVLAVALAAIAYHLTNLTVVGGLLGLTAGKPLLRSITEDFAYYTSTTLGVVALSPLVVVVIGVHWGFLPLLLLPLFLLWWTAALSLEREERALHDDLTGLGNRAMIDQRIQELAAGAGCAAVCLIDLDRFKEVNDSLGHGVGDELLRAVAGRLRSRVRPGDTVARLGGDEFVLLLPVDRHEEARAIIDRLAAHILEPYEIGGACLGLEASIGVVMMPEHGQELEALLRRADAAMYAAKDAGETVVDYTGELERHAPSRLRLLSDLRRGIAAGELEMHYQPQVRVADGALVALEALVRWRHPVRGLLPPGAFLPLAERTTVMRSLSAAILEQVLGQIARWRAGGLHVPVAINVSLHDLSDASFAARVIDGLHRYDLPAGAVTLEITEQALLGDPSRALQTLDALRSGGIELSLDDFGTGHASLTRLKRLPVAELKIERQFVQHLDSRPEDAAIVRSVVELARGLGLRCVAEGVETAEVLTCLVDFGCHVAQGYHIARPMPADAVVEWAARRTAVPRAERATQRPPVVAASGMGA